MNVLNVAVESNNTGVSLLEMERYEEALEVFRSAADLMYVVTQQMKISKSEADAESSSADCKKATETRERIEKIASSVANKSRRTLVAKDETDCFLHDRGFYLSMPSINQEVPCALHSATILANMALAYHLSVPQTSCADNSALRHAMTLYEMAYSVAARIEQNEDSSRVIMAALNNMAQINHECGMYDESRHILDNLQNYIRHQIKAEDYSLSGEKRVYLLNAMFLDRPQGAGAA
jgi:hypothetical protein